MLKPFIFSYRRKHKLKLNIDCVFFCFRIIRIEKLFDNNIYWEYTSFSSVNIFFGFLTIENTTNC